MHDKRAFIDQMFEQLENVSIHAVLATRIELKGKGRNKQALCPFHADNKLGSFVVSEGKNIFKCFSCQAGGNAVKFVSLFDGLNYLEAAFKLGLETGVIDDGQFEEYFGKRRFTKSQVDDYERKYQVKQTIENEKASDAMLNKVFRFFIDAASSEHKGALSEAHRAYLHERGFSDELIAQHEFFTFPTRRIMRELNDKMSRLKEGIANYRNIPGFYYMKEQDKFTFVAYKGIGLPIKNAMGEITGLQIRRDEAASGKSRYVWFSSSFAQNDEKVDFGTSSGSPIDVVYPTEQKNHTVIITEGKFKAIKLAEAVGSVVLSVQGVGSWRQVIPALKSLDMPVKNVLVAYDADMAFNVHVYGQAKQLSDELLKLTPRVFYLWWPAEKGKGIDDVLDQFGKEAVRRYDKSDWDKRYGGMIQSIEASEQEVINKVPQTTVLRYFAKHFHDITPL